MLLHVMFIWPPTIYGEGVCFANVAFFNRFRRHLWTKLYETLCDVYQIDLFGNRTLRIDFVGVGPPEKIGAQNYTYFPRLRNSIAIWRVSISGEEHDIDNRETALETTKGPLHCPKIS